MVTLLALMLVLLLACGGVMTRTPKDTAAPVAGALALVSIILAMHVGDAVVTAVRERLGDNGALTYALVIGLALVPLLYAASAWQLLSGPRNEALRIAISGLNALSGAALGVAVVQSPLLHSMADDARPGEDGYVASPEAGLATLLAGATGALLTGGTTYCLY